MLCGSSKAWNEFRIWVSSHRDLVNFIVTQFIFVYMVEQLSVELGHVF